MTSRGFSRRAFLDAGVVAPLALAVRTRQAPTDTTGPSGPGCDDDHAFHNWARTITCRPAQFCQPESQDEVVQIVKAALQSGKRVRTVGAGHSWAPLVLTGDVLVSLDKMQQILSVDAARLTATVQAGIRLKKLVPALAQKGLGMANLGSILEQSIAGATATATHGTGLGLRNLSSQIAALKLVTGTGDVMTIAAGDRELLNAARVSIGALGIVTEVTLQCVDDYKLEYTAYSCKFDDIVQKIDALNRENTRVRLWWLVPSIGDRDNVILSTMNPPGTAAGIMERSESLAGIGQPPAEIEPLPMDTEALAGATGVLAGSRTGCLRWLRFTGRYEKVMNVPLAPILHRECEYAIPVRHTAEALRSFKRALDEGDLSLKLPVEVRFVAKDESLISPASGEDVCYIGASSQDNANEVFERFEPIMRRLGGRPHWGKCFSLTRKDVESMYPGYAAFRRLRTELDPRGVFANEFMRQLFD
jgi:FAD-linked oxidoreductase